MRRDRISGYALGIVVIVGVVTFTFLRSSANSIGEIMVLASILLIGIPCYVILMNRQFKEMDEVEIRVATTTLNSEPRNALGVLKIAGYQLSYNQRRAVVGVVFIPFLLCGANQLFDLGILGSFGKAALAICAVVAFLTIRFVAPTLAEMQEYRAWRRTP